MKSLFGALLLLLATGCGGAGYAPVTGKVVFEDGSPLTRGNVVFQGKTHTFRGALNDKGEFALQGPEGETGAAPGDYKVYLEGATESTPEASSGSDEHGENTIQEAAKPLVAAKYLNPNESGITKTVSSGGDNFEIKVEKP